MLKSTFDPVPDEEWNLVMEQLRNQLPARPQPFFYARVRARLTAEAQPAGRVPAWLFRPAYAVLLGAVVLALNGDVQRLPGAARPPAAASSLPR